MGLMLFVLDAKGRKMFFFLLVAGHSRKGNFRQTETRSCTEGCAVFRAPATAGSALALGSCLSADSAAGYDRGH